jgi:hypothetical protein
MKLTTKPAAGCRAAASYSFGHSSYLHRASWCCPKS